MLLLDKLIKQSDLHVNPLIKQAYQAIAADIKQAERFVLHKDAVAAMFNVSQTKPTSISSALPWALAPYPLIWIEWSEGDIEAAETEATAAPIPEGRRPRRTGVLIRTLGGPDRGVMTLCWDFPGDEEVNVSWIQQLYDWRDFEGDVLELAALHGLSFPFPVRRASPVPSSSVARQLHLSKAAGKQLETIEERAALQEMWLKCYCVPSNYSFTAGGTGGRVQVSKADYDEAVTSWYGEIAFVVAVLLLMNVKSYLQVEVPEISRRMARRKRPKRLPFSEIKLALPAYQQQRAAENGASKAEIRRHLVRGHFKIRKTGVYWWSHHARGAGPLSKRAGYNVRA